jgi:serine/threonine-protein kinase
MKLYALAMLVSLICVAESAFAQQKDLEKPKARELFDDARRLMTAGQYGDACPKLEESYRLDAGLGTQYNLALCLQKLGRRATAYILFSEVAARAKARGQSDREEVAHARAIALEPTLSRLTIHVEHAIGGLVVQRDGTEVASETWAAAVAVDPGEHTVSATAPGRQPWTTKVLVPDDASTVKVDVPELVRELELERNVAQRHEVAPSIGAVDEGPPGRGWGVQRIVAGVSAAVGVAALGMAVAFSAKSLGEHSDAKRLCAEPKQCGDARGVTAWDGAYSDGNVATVTGSVGAAAIAAAGVLWLMAPKSRPAHARIVPNASRAAAGVSLEVSW